MLEEIRFRVLPLAPVPQNVYVTDASTYLFATESACFGDRSRCQGCQQKVNLHRVSKLPALYVINDGPFEKHDEKVIGQRGKKQWLM